MARLWRNTTEVREGKYLVLRRDGTVPQWPYFVIGASDPAAPAALRAYAASARAIGLDTAYCGDIEQLACDFEAWRAEHGEGDPDAPRHREDDPMTVDRMRTAHGA
jgi:hypothetical protein